MKRKTALLVFMAIYILMEFFPYFSIIFQEIFVDNPFDYARITDVDYKAVLVDDPNYGSQAVITERLTFDIHAASKNNLFWELWRDLPESYIDGVKVDYKINSVKQILDDGSEYIYTESPQLYWYDSDFTATHKGLGPGKWFHSEGPYNESLAQYECVLFYVDGLYREKVTFEIEYVMNNPAFRYKDCSEVYLAMYSGNTIKHLNSFKGEILIPNTNMPDEENYEAHTFGTNSNSFPFLESATRNPGYHTFFFELDKSDLKFRPYNKYIEFTLISFGKDKHKFTKYAPINDYYSDDVLQELRNEQKSYDDEPREYAEFKLIVLLVCVFWSYFIINTLLKADDNIEKKYTFYTPEIPLDYFREIPSNLDPTFASELVFCREKSKKEIKDGFSALVLSLVRKKYIELVKIKPEQDWTFNNVKIIIKKDNMKTINLHPELQSVQNSFNDFYDNITPQNLETLTTTEELYFALIERYAFKNEISMSDFQNKISLDYNNTDKFLNNIEKSVSTIGVSYGYFQKADYQKPKKELKAKSLIYLIIGLLILIVVNLISYHTRLDFALGGFTILGISYLFGSYIYKKLSKKYVLLTQFGEDEYAKWRGLYNFLNSDTLMNERTVIDLPLWEQYLVYATAFGISEKVIKALKIRCPEIDQNSMLSNSYYRSTNFYSNNRYIRSTVRSTSYYSNGGYSSGYGGHGGYGGGGRGGGGGGGGH